MPEQEKRKLIRRTAVQSIIVLLLLTGCLIFGWRLLVKAGERRIFRGIQESYPDLMYDRKLARIAEDCARLCRTQELSSNDIRILENADFVAEYSEDTYVFKYTQTADSDAAFIDRFLSDMQEESYYDTAAYLKQCQYIGIGKYGKQVFLLAFYQE